jgi:hypothetical protein
MEAISDMLNNDNLRALAIQATIADGFILLNSTLNKKRVS